MNHSIMAQSVGAITVEVKGAELVMSYRRRAADMREVSRRIAERVGIREAEHNELAAQVAEAKEAARTATLPMGIGMGTCLRSFPEHERASYEAVISSCLRTADYLEFMAEHLDPKQTFLLSDSDVAGLVGPLPGFATFPGIGAYT
jgi:hypothetical protein